jgi:hypothetical protein
MAPVSNPLAANLSHGVYGHVYDLAEDHFRRMASWLAKAL